MGIMLMDLGWSGLAYGLAGQPVVLHKLTYITRLRLRNGYYACGLT